jgi:two-component system response regulator
MHQRKRFMESQKYILCIDDDKDDCLLLGEAITQVNQSYAVRFIDSGEGAIRFLTEVLENNRPLPGLITLDVNMPRVNGQETLVQIQKLLGRIYIPVIFLTTSPRDIDLVLAEGKGVSIVAKPRTIKGYDDLAKTIFGSMLL